MPNAPRDARHEKHPAGNQPSELTNRLVHDIARLTQNEGRIGIAVSGGADSLALLLLAQAAMPQSIMAATVDHGLRPEAAEEAIYVGEICTRINVHHTVLTPCHAITGTVQAGARKARYEALGAWADDHQLAWIATAHHREDQAETFIMRLLRGSGIEGLSSIREINGRIIRPVLGWHRAELRAVVGAAGVIPVEDPSNDDRHYDRVRIRQRLAENSWIEAAALAKSAGALASANEALEWAAAREAKARIATDGAGISLDARELPADLVRRLIRLAMLHVDPNFTPRTEQVIALAEKLVVGGKVTLGPVVAVGGAIWHFSLAPRRRTN